MKNEEHIKLVDIIYQLYSLYMIEDFRPIYALEYQGLKPYDTFA